MDRPARPYTRTIWALMIVAVVCSLGLLVAATTLPAYESESVSSSTVIGGADAGHHATAVTHSTATLVEVNGPQSLEFLALPLLASLIVATALLRRRTGRLARVIAWVVTGVMGISTMLAMMTVGPAIVPVTGCLVMACAFDAGRPSGPGPLIGGSEPDRGR
jgi:hypothetical protein